MKNAISSRWFQGPEFLKLNKEEWPVEPCCPIETRPEDLEFKKEIFAVILPSPEFAYLPEVQRFSSYIRLVRSTARVIIAWKLFRSFARKEKYEKSTELPIRTAQQFLTRRSQWESYAEEMHQLQQQQQVNRKSPLYQLNPCLDQDGVLRMHTRLVKSNEEGLSMPVIVHPKEELTKLIVMHYHIITNHGNSDIVHNEVRQRYWIPTGKTAIKSIVRNCQWCKVRKVKAIQPPRMAALPECRIQQQSRPFSIVGMDYMGPFFVTVRRSQEKRYGVIFTCMSTRAVHMEIAHSLTTDSCIMAIRRMIARRGQPVEIHSDNGTNLRGADKELKENLEELNKSRLKEEFEIIGIKWLYSPPSAAHFGGVWERLVRSVKTALYTSLKSRAPKDEILLTLIIEAEAIVNARPLIDVPSDPEMPEALTPFHFLIGTSSVLHPPNVSHEKDVDLGKQWKRSQALTEMFWRRWRREYLPTLQKRTKWYKSNPNLEVGEVVVLFDESL